MSVNSKELAHWFKELKPRAIDLTSNSPNAAVASFIRGFVDAEGSVDQKVRRISIAQKDAKFLQKIQLLLTRFGIASRMRLNGKKQFPMLELFSSDVVKFNELIGLTAEDKKKKLEFWANTFQKNKAKEIVPIQRKAVKELLESEFGFSDKILKSRNYPYITVRELEKVRMALGEKGKLSAKAQKARQLMGNLLDNQVWLEKVRTVKEVENTKPLYDISVPATENYVANGFIVHNSKTRLYLRKAKENKRVAKLVDSPSLPDGEAVYAVTPNGIEDM